MEIHPIYKESDAQIIRKTLEDKSNFIMISPEDQTISPKEPKPFLLTQFPLISCRGWEEFHRELHKYNSFVPSGNDGLNMILLLASDKKIYDGKGTQIHSSRLDEIKDTLFRDTNEIFSTKFTSDSPISTHSNIDVGRGNLIINYNYHINEGGELVPEYSESLNFSVTKPIIKGENCYVDLNSFNEQGFPTKKSKEQQYIQGKNIFYYNERWFNQGSIIELLSRPDKSSLFYGISREMSNTWARAKIME